MEKNKCLPTLCAHVFTCVITVWLIPLSSALKAESCFWLVWFCTEKFRVLTLNWAFFKKNVLISYVAFVHLSHPIIGPTDVCALAEPTWRRAPSAGLVCWVSWRSCGGGSVWRTRIWPSRCPSEETSPPCCSSRTTARCVSCHSQCVLATLEKIHFQWKLQKSPTCSNLAIFVLF